MKTISVDKYYMETKRCTSCKFELPPGSFNRNKSRKDGLQSKCRECSRIHTRNYYRENIEDQRAKTLARNRATQEKLYILVNEYLTKHPCPCGESDPVVIEAAPEAPAAPTVELDGPIVPSEDTTTPVTGKVHVPEGTVPETVTVTIGDGDPIEVPVANITGPDENGDYSFTVDVPTEALVPGTPVTAEATVKDPETGKVYEPGESDPVGIEAAP